MDRADEDVRSHMIEQYQRKLRGRWINFVYAAAIRDGNAYTNPNWSGMDNRGGIRLSSDKRDTFLPELMGGPARVVPTAIILSGM